MGPTTAPLWYPHPTAPPQWAGGYPPLVSGLAWKVRPGVVGKCPRSKTFWGWRPPGLRQCVYLRNGPCQDVTAGRPQPSLDAPRPSAWDPSPHPPTKSSAMAGRVRQLVAHMVMTIHCPLTVWHTGPIVYGLDQDTTRLRRQTGQRVRGRQSGILRGLVPTPDSKSGGAWGGTKTSCRSRRALVSIPAVAAFSRRLS